MVRLTLHGRVHLSSDEKLTTSKFVRCPEDGRWAPVEGCRRCAKRGSIEEGAVTCDPEATAVSRDMETAPIAEVMDANVLCVDSDAPVESVKRTMDELGAPIAIVVDRAHHAIGVCSRSDLPERSQTRRVVRFMTPFVITMLGKTTVAYVVDLIADRDLHHIPVLSEGRVVGVVTQRAVIRWLAQNLREAHASRVSPRLPRANTA
jgi:CBS domain-containing protein